MDWTATGSGRGDVVTGASGLDYDVTKDESKYYVLVGHPMYSWRDGHDYNELAEAEFDTLDEAKAWCEGIEYVVLVQQEQDEALYDQMEREQLEYERQVAAGENV